MANHTNHKSLYPYKLPTTISEVDTKMYDGNPIKVVVAKPVKSLAIRYDGTNIDEVRLVYEFVYVNKDNSPRLHATNLDGDTLYLNPKEWLVKTDGDIEVLSDANIKSRYDF